MGRPRGEDPKTEVVQIRMTPSMLRQVDRSRGDQSRSDWCRQAILRQVIKVRA